MKKWFLTFGLGFLAVWFIACGGSSPKDVAVEFMESAYRGDSSQMLSYLILPSGSKDDELAKGMLAGKMEMAAKEAKKKADNAGGVKKIEILSEDITDNQAIIKLRVHFKDGTTDDETAKLRKTEQGWKIGS